MIKKAEGSLMIFQNILTCPYYVKTELTPQLYYKQISTHIFDYNSQTLFLYEFEQESSFYPVGWSYADSDELFWDSLPEWFTMLYARFAIHVLDKQSLRNTLSAEPKFKDKMVRCYLHAYSILENIQLGSCLTPDLTKENIAFLIRMFELIKDRHNIQASLHHENGVATIIAR